MKKDDWADVAPLPPPPSSFLAGLLESIPAVLMVLDAEGTIRFTAGQLDRIGERSDGQLVGSKLSEFSASKEIVDNLVAFAADSREGELIGPVRVPYLDVDGTSRLTEMWAVNRSSNAGLSGARSSKGGLSGIRSSNAGLNGVLVILLPESAYERFDHAVASVGSAPVDETLASLAVALRFPPVGGECYFLRPAADDRGLVRSPDLGEVPGPPLMGPWDEVWLGAPSVLHEDLDDLPFDLADAARVAGFQSVSCFALAKTASTDEPGPCLVVWSYKRGPLAPFARLAIERALKIAELAVSHRVDLPVVADSRDQLTGLSNRKGFFEVLSGMIEARQQPAVFCVDLDGFSSVNDTFGQLAGDAVLRVTARRLASTMRPTDELARLGADEFAVICADVASADVVTIAERIISQLSRPLSVGDGVAVDLGASVGIAHGLPVGTPVDALFGRADDALDQAKAKGRGQWALFAGR